MTDAQAITEKRQQIFDENNPLKKESPTDEDEDDEDELYDESGDEEAVGWSDGSEDSSVAESPRKQPEPIKETVQEPEQTVPTPSETIEISEGNADSTSTPEPDSATVSAEVSQESTPEVLSPQNSDGAPTLNNTDTDEEPTEESRSRSASEERGNPTEEDSYRETDLFQQLEELKAIRSRKSLGSISPREQSSKPTTRSPLAQATKAETEPPAPEKQPATRKESAPPRITAEKALVQLVLEDEAKHPTESPEPTSRMKRADCRTNLGVESIALRDGGRPRAGTRSVEVLVPLRTLDDPKPRAKSPAKQQARHSLQSHAVADDNDYSASPNRKRDLESELAIDGAPVLPGADYFYNQADLDMLKEMEERSAMKAAFVQAGAQDIKKTNSDIKKKLRVASEMLGRFKAEEQSVSAADLAERKAQLDAIKKQKEKNHTENLLSESTDLPANIRMRNLTINEFVKSERDFCLDMQILIDVFCEPLQNNGVITAQQYSTLFSNISMIYEICCSIVSAMEAAVRNQEHPCLSSCFTQLVGLHVIVVASFLKR